MCMEYIDIHTTACANRPTGQRCPRVCWGGSETTGRRGLWLKRGPSSSGVRGAASAGLTKEWLVAGVTKGCLVKFRRVITVAFRATGRG